MPKLFMSLDIGSTLARTISVSHPPEQLATYTPEAWDIGCAQGFIWYPNFLGFVTRGEVGAY